MSMVRLEERMTNYRPGPEPTRTRREWDTGAAAEERAASDDEFAAQVERCYQPLCSMLRRRFSHSISSVDDLARDALAQAWEKRGCFDPVRGTLFNWLRSIAEHRAISELRHHQLGTILLSDSEVEETLPDCVPGPGEQHESNRRQCELRRLLRMLPDRQRRAVVLRCLQRLTLPETAKKLNLSQSQVFRAVATGMRTLALKLKHAENTPNLPQDRDSPQEMTVSCVYIHESESKKPSLQPPKGCAGVE